jgi:hypothetical protein
MVEDYYKDKGYSEKKIKKKVSDYCESKVLVFRDEDGDAIYRLNKDCANPVGDLSDDGLPAPKYELDPNVTLSHSGAVENSVDYIVTPSISNNGTVTRDTEWRLTKLTANSGNDISPDENSRSDRSPCSFYSSDRCETIKKGEAIFDTDGSVESKISGDDFSAYSSNTGDTPLGTEVCFVLSVKPWATHDPYRESDEEWRHSATRCFKIVKKPKVQILGGDLISGGKIQTSTSSKNIGGTTRMFGSWDEYAALAVGSISGIGSGAAFAGPGLVSQTVCRYSMLSFNNVDCSLSPSTLGNYSMSNLMPDIAATFPDNRSVFFNNTIVANDLVKDLSNGIYVRHHDGNLTLSQSELEPGKSLVLKVNGTVTISGNQTYNLDNNGSNYKSVAQLPQLLIIANNINIADAVTNIDAWLIVKNGYINTCSSNRGAPLVVGASLSAGICDRQLTFNGPVFTNKLYLRRTAGSGNGLDYSGDPAEVFNLRADAYLWSAARASSNGQVFSIKTIELPPRL